VNTPRRGYQRSAGGLIGAMIAVLLFIGAIWGLTWFERRPSPDPTPTIQYAAALAEARAEAPFHVVAPAPVPAGLRATSVEWQGTGARKTWQLGFLTPQDEYVGLYQGTGPAGAFIAAHTPASQPGSPALIRNAQWLTLSASDRGEHAFVRTAHGVTIVVTGTASPSVLRQFVAALH
jgi:hypothetical protein